MSGCPIPHDQRNAMASTKTSALSSQGGSWWSRPAPESFSSRAPKDSLPYAPKANKACPKAAPAASQCPVQHDDRWTRDMPLNPKNMMPDLPQTRLSYSAQQNALGTDRSLSTIPRGNSEGEQSTMSGAYQPQNAAEESHWVYPSQQQFYNALARKGYETDEKDIPVILAIHNDLNEQSWAEVCRWEKASSDCPPKLLRFMGKPTTLSPKARFYTFFGSPKPFDRHDWVIERCGQPVRYILDYYEAPHVPGKANFYVDCRPAADSVQNVWARAKRQLGFWSSDHPSGKVTIQ